MHESLIHLMVREGHVLVETGLARDVMQGLAHLLASWQEAHEFIRTSSKWGGNHSEWKSVGSGYHQPVLWREVLQWMGVRAGDYIVDGTLGGGGHSRLLLEEGARVLGIDRDPEAIKYATELLAGYGAAFSAHLGLHSEMDCHSVLQPLPCVDGVLLDLGVSSHQLDCAERGFSFQKDGPLDMRMGANEGMTASDFVNGASFEELRHVFVTYGEEPQARRIAELIVRERSKQPFLRTLELARCIESNIGRKGKHHPATRVFQAIRIHVNDELASINRSLSAALRCLKPGGRLLVITFHSLEDRLVKQFLQFHAQAELDDVTWSAPKPNPDFFLNLPTRKAIAAQTDEIKANPRSRSAKLRVAIRNSTPYQVNHKS